MYAFINVQKYYDDFKVGSTRVVSLASRLATRRQRDNPRIKIPIKTKMVKSIYSFWCIIWFSSHCSIYRCSVICCARYRSYSQLSEFGTTKFGSPCMSCSKSYRWRRLRIENDFPSVMFYYKIISVITWLMVTWYNNKTKIQFLFTTVQGLTGMLLILILSIIHSFAAKLGLPNTTLICFHREAYCMSHTVLYD